MRGNLKAFIINFLLICLPIIFIGLAFDSVYYGKLTITAVNFFIFNVTKGLSNWFGESPWHYFLTVLMKDYLKILFLLYIPAYFYDLHNDIKSKRFPEISCVIAMYLISLSRIPHKEG